MKPKEFFDKVSELREAQKEYFKTRSNAALNWSGTSIGTVTQQWGNPAPRHGWRLMIEYE